MESQNLVPNGGFESRALTPLKWNKSGADFSQILDDWNSPTQASPDVYGPGISVPSYWRKQGFGFITPVEGSSFVGATLYGCKNGKPHCREYIQVKMKEPLVPGQQYELSFMTSPLPRGLRINNIGVGFSYDSVKIIFDHRIEIIPAAHIKRVVSAKPGKWVKAKLLFQAQARESYLIIGNFHDDRDTKMKKDPLYSKLKYAYYYFDNVQLKKIPPIIAYVDTTNVYLARSYEIDDRVILENIYFDFDKATLLPKSYLTLSHLLELLNEYPELSIRLVGHTDNDGPNAYNRKLSKRRANVVYHYLIKKGIDKHRLDYQGEGESQPLGTNDTAEGKALNRRVEFQVVEK